MLDASSRPAAAAQRARGFIMPSGCCAETSSPSSASRMGQTARPTAGAWLDRRRVVRFGDGIFRASRSSGIASAARSVARPVEMGRLVAGQPGRSAAPRALAAQPNEARLPGSPAASAGASYGSGLEVPRNMRHPGAQGRRSRRSTGRGAEHRGVVKPGGGREVFVELGSEQVWQL